MSAAIIRQFDTGDARANFHDAAADEYVCWSRMQAEAGQALEAIVRRKEMERRSGEGLFFWGVGNAPAVAAAALAKLGQPVRAVFLIMKSKQKDADVRPSGTVCWRRYVDLDGNLRLLPRHVLVTSRAETAGGTKSRHFALMCRSQEPLEIRRGVPFDPSSFRNAGAGGGAVGASQVTALLRRIPGAAPAASAYEANLTAWLAGAYWVKLADPVPCEPDISRLDMQENISVDRWLDFVDLARGGGRVAAIGDSRQGVLL